SREADSKLLAVGAAGEIHAQRECELGMALRLWIIEQRQLHVGCVAPVLPVARATGGQDAHRPDRSGSGMESAEQVDIKVTSESGTVVGVVAPAEQADGIEGVLRRVSDEAIPVDGFRRRVQRQRI